ncbi:DNA mismatch repair protein MutH [Lachnospiraceae bacterium KHCPX20]|nr:DNA mismatch repair protein MutH [Lachnospiraceae bacterium KHCPX20]
MFDEKLGYDPADAKSIEKYAVQLENKTFLEVVQESGNLPSDAVMEYANRFRKGGLGNLLEEVYFGYKANSNQEADFPEAGVELKTTPYEVTKKGELRAGERLVLTMISYDEPVEMDFYKSHAWDKMCLILLIYYWRNRQLESNLLYKIGYVRMFTPPEVDLEIIKRDYALIISMIQAGRAHELSEADTMYLGACTKGATAEKSTVPQYYGDKTPARKRAFCFKNSYMTYVLNHYVVGKTSDNSILKNSEIIKEKSFEEILEDIVAKYVGKSDKELCDMFGREYNNNKAQWNDLAFRILGIRDEHAEEFEKANIRVKTIRLEENGKIRENMSFAPFKFMDLVNEDFDDSTLKDYFDETRLFFFVWEKDGDVYRVKGCQLWHMSYEDLNITVRKEWEKYKHIIQYGVMFKKKTDSQGKVSFENNLPNKSETEIIHIRPHAQKAAYRFNNGEEYGNVDRDANMLPNGEYMTTQSFWINNTYILKQLKKS